MDRQLSQWRKFAFLFCFVIRSIATTTTTTTLQQENINNNQQQGVLFGNSVR
jgi:hypothetical protein